MKDFLLFIHILAAIVWFGGLLFVVWGVYPTARLLPIYKQKKFLIQLMTKSHIGFIIAGGLVLLTGFLMGITVPIDSLSQLVPTYYGKWWLISFATGIITLGWGTFIGYRAMIRPSTLDRLFYADDHWDGNHNKTEFHPYGIFPFIYNDWFFKTSWREYGE